MFINLSKQTIANLSHLLPSTSVPITIQYKDVTVGICSETSLPECIILPAGLRASTNVHSSVGDVQAAEHITVPPDLITLRYAISLFLSPSSAEKFAHDLRNAKVLSVGGNAFVDGKVLGDIVPERSISQPFEISAFNCINSESNALVCSRVGASTDGSFVPVDTLLYCEPTTTRSQLSEILAEVVYRTLKAIFNTSEQGRVRISHHAVLGSELCLTQIVPIAEEELSEEATVRRRGLHNSFCLPTNKPLFKWVYRTYSSSIAFSDGGYPGRLKDVHIGIKPHGLGDVGVTVHVVQGHYLYCHYLQDKFNDSGWGCAYRSLQTILSWCAMEKYCTFANGRIPTHSEIQKALVDVGDKQSSFIGTKDWIGANEVCYALEKLTGIGSKILHVSRGSEMESKGRELARHFDEQGSPVMVGGGVLAWTILGVARNSRTGKMRFLILDPHHEGWDDLKLIQSKGWIGWKPADIFSPNAFYNLCMPQRPSGV